MRADEFLSRVAASTDTAASPSFVSAPMRCVTCVAANWRASGGSAGSFAREHRPVLLPDQVAVLLHAAAQQLDQGKRALLQGDFAFRVTRFGVGRVWPGLNGGATLEPLE